MISKSRKKDKEGIDISRDYISRVLSTPFDSWSIQSLKPTAWQWQQHF